MKGKCYLGHEHEFEPFGIARQQSFGPYVVLGELGSGGMGTVYRSWDTRLERQVAIKALRCDPAVSGPRERFLREARLASSLNQANICTIFDIGEHDGEPYLVMELLEGESLKECLQRGPMAADDIREVAFRVGLALQAAHAKGIVHRDIKPANLFLVKSRRGSMDVKVLDFGLAKIAADRRSPAQESDDLTRAGATVGTVEYMSPEQACGEPLDARSDLFSLGAVLYEMATGSVPFRGATSAVVFSELLNREPVPPREKNLNVPPGLDRLIRRLLVKDRASRLGSATEMLAELTRLKATSHSLYAVLRNEQVQEHALNGLNRPGKSSSSEQASVPDTAIESRTEAKPLHLMEPHTAGNAGPTSTRAAGGAERAKTMRRAVNARFQQTTSVHVGWKVALGAGVLVAILVTLLAILLMARGTSANRAVGGVDARTRTQSDAAGASLHIARLKKPFTRLAAGVAV